MTEPPTPDLNMQYTIQAQFIGRGVSQAETNLDVKGIALMPYWIGTVASNSVVSVGDGKSRHRK
jgi:hypothetical protein